MKRDLLKSFLCLSLFTSQVCLADVLSCEATYEGKPFVQLTIWADTTGFGPAECDYKNPKDAELTVYKFPEQNEYYAVSGEWHSTMPGYKWCSTDDGNTYASCTIAKRERTS